MIIFSLDSSSKSASAAVVRDGVILSESFANIGLTHSETLLELCDEALRRASVTPREVDFFAVTSGPGSFTGLRIGMGLIKGMAFATKKPCVGVPTFEALAFGVLGTKRTVVATCDARRGRVYCAAFSAEKKVERIFDDCVLSLDELCEKLQGKQVVFVGDAAEICYNHMNDKIDCARVSGGSVMVRAGNVGLSAIGYIQTGATVDAAELKPSYVQLTQAEQNLNKTQEKI